MSKKRYCLAIVCLVGVFCVSIKAQPLAQYTFNDGTSKDVTGNGYDGVLLGGAVVVTDSEHGQVLQINESGMQADGPFEITTSFTLSAWVKLDVPRTGRYYFGGPWWIRTDNQGGSEHYWCEIRYPDGSFVDKFDTRSGNSPEGQLDGQWHHIAVVLPEDGAVKAYVDGALAPVRDNNTKAHNFEGAVGPLFFGTQDADGANAIKGYMDDIRVFNYAVGEADILGLMVEVGGLGPESAHKPDPSSGASDVLRDVILGWKPGEFAPPVNGHIVYISENFNDVNDGSGGIVQDANSYAPAQRLDFDTTYYWRVDEVNAPPTSTVYRGSVWSFTTEPIAIPIDGNNITATASSVHQTDTGPENTINGSGLDANDLHSTESTDMWLSSNEPNGAWIEYDLDKVYKLHGMLVWNYNGEGLNTIYGLRDVIIEHSTDGTSWTPLSDVPEFPKAPGTDDYYGPSIVNIGNVIARYVKITATSNWIGGMFNQYGLSEVRFMAIPVSAREPSPDSGATGVDPSIVLGWRAGRDAASHDVYVGSDANDLAPAGTVGQNSLDTASLDLQLGETYHWKVNEVNDAETPTIWQGDIWSFTTPDSLVVDDFESYNDIPDGEEGSNFVYMTWIDGYDNPSANGSTIGYVEAYQPSMETDIVHGGKQSVPLMYDNSVAAYSEATRTFDTPQDWTRAGVQTLVVHFYEDSSSTGGQLYVKVNDKKVVYDPGTIITPPGWLSWKQWNIDLASVGTDLSSVNTLAIGVDGAWATGVTYIDDILLYKSAPPVPKVLTWFEAESGTITFPMNIYAGDITASGEQYIGTDEELGDETGAPPEDGIATYSFSVPGGVYKLVLRIVATSGSNTFWVRIPNATTNTTNHPTSGWVLLEQSQLSDDWQWTEVTSRNDDNQVVEFTLPAGTHTLEVARREDGTLLDAIAIVSLTD